MISALACVGLFNDRLEVRFDELIGWSGEGKGGAKEPVIPYPAILGELRERVTDLPNDEEEACWRTALSRFGACGEQLGLVEAYSHKVRFPHSILQSYLASGFLQAVQENSVETLAKALEDPGRELLIALIMRSRREPAAQADTVRLLLDAAERRRDDKAIDLYAAVLEIDTGELGDSAHPDIAKRIRERWCELTEGDPRTLDEAKLRLVHRFGEAARRLDRALKEEESHGNWEKPAYGDFMRISWIEQSYPVRLAIAQEIGAGSDHAFDALRELFPWPEKKNVPDTDKYDPWEQYKLAMAELEYEEGAQREKKIGLPGVSDLQEAYKNRTAVEIWREFVTRAWLVPMVVGSVGSDRRSQAQERMKLWLQHLLANPATGRADLPISLEIALAQGFKNAANRRRRHPATSNEAREFLIERAEFMLARARYWYSQLTLIHALCLWELPDGTDVEPDGTMRGSRAGTDPVRAVERWLGIAGSEQAPGDRPADELAAEGGKRLHPFVAEAGDLAALALETRHPERFIWIDEKGTSANIGSSTADPEVHRRHNLWIPPSVGWSTLHPRAQQLLADVMLLLNLTEGDGLKADDARLHRTNRTVLPPCLTMDRGVLQPERTVGMPGTAEPGTGCLRNCKFELCPYPPRGGRPGSEFREPFCRQQQALLGKVTLRRRQASWQGMTVHELKAFWRAMAERTRTPSTAPQARPKRPR